MNYGLKIGPKSCAFRIKQFVDRALDKKSWWRSNWRRASINSYIWGSWNYTFDVVSIWLTSVMRIFLEYGQLRILFLQNNSDSNWQMFSGFPNAYCRKNVELNHNLIAGHDFFQVIRDFFHVYSCWLPYVLEITHNTSLRSIRRSVPSTRSICFAYDHTWLLIRNLTAVNSNRHWWLEKTFGRNCCTLVHYFNVCRGKLQKLKHLLCMGIVNTLPPAKELK